MRFISVKNSSDTKMSLYLLHVPEVIERERVIELEPGKSIAINMDHVQSMEVNFAPH